MFIAISKVDIGINFTELRGALMIIVITLIIIIIIPLTEVNLLETITLTLIWLNQQQSVDLPEQLRPLRSPVRERIIYQDFDVNKYSFTNGGPYILNYWRVSISEDFHVKLDTDKWKLCWISQTRLSIPHFRVTCYNKYKIEKQPIVKNRKKTKGGKQEGNRWREIDGKFMVEMGRKSTVGHREEIYGKILGGNP